MSSTDQDFQIQQNQMTDTDELLTSVQNHDLFAGKTRWCDLEIKHFHIMIVNILRMLGKTDDTVRANDANPLVVRLTFFLCAFIKLLQENSGSSIDLLRVNRVSDDDVVYDYTATLDVKIAPIKSGLKVVK